MELLKKTKIVCTIGPASESEEMLEKLANAGMNVVRFNFSHDVHENHLKRMERVRTVSEKLGINLSILLDTKDLKFAVQICKMAVLLLKKVTSLRLVLMRIILGIKSVSAC